MATAVISGPFPIPVAFEVFSLEVGEVLERMGMMPRTARRA